MSLNAKLLHVLERVETTLKTQGKLFPVTYQPSPAPSLAPSFAPSLAPNPALSLAPSLAPSKTTLSATATEAMLQQEIDMLRRQLVKARVDVVWKEANLPNAYEKTVAKLKEIQEERAAVSAKLYNSDPPPTPAEAFLLEKRLDVLESDETMWKNWQKRTQGYGKKIAQERAEWEQVNKPLNRAALQIMLSFYSCEATRPSESNYIQEVIDKTASAQENVARMEKTMHDNPVLWEMLRVRVPLSGGATTKEMVEQQAHNIQRTKQLQLNPSVLTETRAGLEPSAFAQRKSALESLFGSKKQQPTPPTTTATQPAFAQRKSALESLFGSKKQQPVPPTTTATQPSAFAQRKSALEGLFGSTKQQPTAQVTRAKPVAKPAPSQSKRSSTTEDIATLHKLPVSTTYNRDLWERRVDAYLATPLKAKRHAWLQIYRRLYVAIPILKTLRLLHEQQGASTFWKSHINDLRTAMYGTQHLDIVEARAVLGMLPSPGSSALKGVDDKKLELIQTTVEKLTAIVTQTGPQTATTSPALQEHLRNHVYNNAAILPIGPFPVDCAYLGN